MLITFPETLQDVVIHQDLNGLDWFHAGSVCAILGFSNPSDVVSNNCPDAAKLLDYQEGRGRAALFISEYGLYELIMVSKKEIGAKFRRWLAYEVLPSIRKTGTYTATAADQQHFSPFGLTIAHKIQETEAAIAAAAPGELAPLVRDRLALEKLLKATPTKEVLDREQAIENHILERLGRFPKGVTIQHLIVSRFLEKHQARRIKVILPVLQKLRSQGRCEEISPNTWKLTGDPS